MLTPLPIAAPVSVDDIAIKTYPLPHNIEKRLIENTSLLSNFTCLSKTTPIKNEITAISNNVNHNKIVNHILIAPSYLIICTAHY